MASSSVPNAGRRALRRNLRSGNAGTPEIGPSVGNVVEAAEPAIHSRKRKKPTQNEDSQDTTRQGELAQNEARNEDSQDTTRQGEVSQNKALEGAGVSATSKPRGRLLELLGHHVMKKKKVRDESQETQSKPTKSKRRLAGARAHEDQPSRPVDEGPSCPRDPDFELFTDQQLQQMVQGVGLDTAGLLRAELVKACKAYHELIILPTGWDSFQFTADSHLTSGASQAEGMHNSVTPDVQPSVVEQSTSSPKNSEPGASTSLLPSLERGNLLYPRPRPTVLSFTQGSASLGGKGKGKAKAREGSHASDPDWDPSSQGPTASDGEGEMEDLEDLEEEIDVGGNGSRAQASTREIPTTTTSTRKSAARSRDKSSRTHLPNPPKPKNKDISPDADRMLDMIYELQDKLRMTNQQLKTLTDEFKVLTQVTRKYIDEESEQVGAKKTRGGRISLSVRFHIDTLLGQGENNNSLPAPATTAEKESWMSELEINDINFDLDLSHEDAESQDQTDGGPRHKDSTPQQLSIMQQMMKAVGVSSFRPDFSQASTSKDNKWLWDLALKIFIKLVECGEYVGISLDRVNIPAIKKAFDTRVQSLMKRYRQQAWDQERQKKAADTVRRSARLRYLKKSRERIVLSRKDLWPLSLMVQEGCSDDETEHEDCQEPLSQHVSSAVHIRKLAWRSSALQLVLQRLDAYKGKLDSSTPNKKKSQSNNSSPKGRPSRPRIRCENGPLSQVPAPSGLSIDCYSAQWLQTLSPLDRSQLEINPERTLSRLIPIVNTL